MEELDLGQTIRGFVAGQKVFERYVLKAVLGRGGMGIVWRAFDEHLDRDVALKFLPELIIHDRAVLDDLKRETKRNLDLTHHHIVRIYDFAQDSNSACISMEYVDGETLSALRVDRPDKVFEADQLAQPISELCEALTYAHTRASIVHRDLKPANLMLNSKGTLKVTDFGIARSLSDSISMLTMNRSVSGTLLYMSPQQLDGERASALDDIYSVGATVYELLTSRPPFYTGSVERQIHEKTAPPMAVRRADLGIVSTIPIPQHWEETVAACLAKDPAQRPQTAGALLERFRGRPAERPIEILPPPPPAATIPVSPSPVIPPSIPTPVPAATAEPTSGRSKGPIFGAILAGVALLAGLALFFIVRSTDESGRETSLRSPAAETSASTQAASSPIVTPAQREQFARETSAPSVSASTPPATSSPAATAAAQHSAPYSSSDGYDPAIVFVDMNGIFREYGKTKDSEAKINDAKNAAKKEYDERAETYKKGLEEINQLSQQLDSPSLSASAKAAKAKERDEKIAAIKEMEKAINEFRQTREKQLQESAMKLREEIIGEITREVTSLLPASRSMVYDRSGPSMNGVPVVVFSPARADRSDKVISALNRKGRSTFTVAHDLSFAVVDMNRIFKEYKKTKDSEAKINDAKNAAKKEYDDRAASYKKALEVIDNLNTRLDSPSLNAGAKQAVAAERDKKIADIKNMEREINEFRQTRERQLQEQAMRMREGIVKEITDAIGKGLAQNADAVVVDISGMSMNGVPLAVFVSGVPDFSADVIAALNGTKSAAVVKFRAPLATAKSLRFGVIDMNRAFKAWPETKPAEAKINEAKEAARKEYDAQAERYQKDLAEINNLSEGKERAAKIARLKTSENEMNEFKATREKQLQEQALKMREEIVGKITAVLKATAGQENFNLVFDSSGQSMNGVPITVLVPGIPDLTDKVLKK